jgi:hypothetical protein
MNMKQRFTGEEWRYRRGTWESDYGSGPPPLPPSTSSRVTREDAAEVLGTIWEMLAGLAGRCAHALGKLGALVAGLALWAWFRFCQLAHGFFAANLHIEDAFGGSQTRLIGSTRRGTDDDQTVDHVLAAGTVERARLGSGAVAARVVDSEAERVEVRRG